MIHFFLNWLKNHKWSTALIVLFVSLLVLMPIALQTGLQQLLLKQGQPHGIDRVEIDDIDFNPFMATFSLKNLTLYRDQQLLAEIKQLDLRLSLRDLLQKRLMVDSFTLSDTHIPLRLTEDNHLEIAGFPIPLEPAPESKPEKDNSQLAIEFGIKNLHFSNLSIALESDDRNTTYTIQDLTINKEADYSRLILASHLNNTPLNANLQLHHLADYPKIIGTLKVDKLDLGQFQHFIPDLPLHAILSNEITFTLQQDSKGFAIYQQGSWSIDGFELKQDPQNLTFKKLDWNGDLYFFRENSIHPSETPPKLTLKGQANLQGFNFSDGENKISHDAIANLDLVTILDTKNPTITQTGKLIIKQFKLDSPSIKSENKQTTWLGKIDFNGGKTPLINAKGLLAMSDVKTSLPAQKVKLQHQLNANLNLQVNLGAASTGDIKIQQTGDLSLNNVHITQLPLELNLEKTNWNGELHFSQNAAVADSASTMSITSNGQLKASGFRALNQKNQLILAQFETLNIGNLLVKQLADISLQSTQLTNLNVAQPKDLKQPGLVNLKTLKLDHAKLQNFKQLRLGTLELQGSETHLTFDKDGKIRELAYLVNSLPKPEKVADVTVKPTNDIVKSTSSEKTSTKKSDFHYQLNGIKTVDSHLIHLTSQQIVPPLIKTIQLSTLTLGQINSQKPFKPTPYNLALQLNEFSHLHSQGTLQPLNPKFNLEAKTKLEGFSLLEFSPLIEQKLGYQIKSGQLSLDATTNIKDSVINAENQIHLNKFVIATADRSKTALIEKDFTMPLEAGLALLKDKKDNIDLKLPIKGNIDSPDFQLQSVISKAINSSLIKASRTYLLLALQPFGAILLAGEFAADQLSAVKLQSVIFAPGDSSLSLEMLVYMAKINKVLDDRKSIQIKLCGGANELDRNALLIAQQKEAPKANGTRINENSAATADKKPDSISDAQLIALAAERQAVIKRHLIKIGSQSKQIIICQPKITASNQPTVDLGI